MIQKSIIFITVHEMELSLAKRIKELRLLKNLKRTTLAKNAGVSQASLKRFETTGKSSLENLLKLAHAMGRLNEFENLLKPPNAQSIKELELRTKRNIPKRGRK